MDLQTTKTLLLTLVLVATLGACGGGEPDPEPTPDPEPGNGATPTLSVAPDQGPVGSAVTIRADGLEPGERVGIGFGPPRSEYRILTRVRADAEGHAEATVQVPDWAEAGRSYLWVAAPEGPGGEAMSPEFRVTAGPGDGGDEGTIRVTGVLTDAGVECQALETDDDELYTLTGELGGYEAGDRVTVEGRVAGMSYCMQGTTIAVERIRSVP